MDLEFRLMTAPDIPFGMALKTFAGWNQVEADWRAFLAYEPDGCFVAEADGRPAGTVTTIRFQDRVGWIGMLLVHPDRRRRGIGTALLERAIRHLRDHAIPAIKLDATPAGRLVYVRRDFRDEYEIERRQGMAREAAAPDLAPIRPDDFPEVLDLDLEAFGVERERVIARGTGENPHTSFAARGADGRLAGFIVARPGSRAFQIGPWVARDPATAGALFSRVLAALAGAPVFLDVLRGNAPALEIVREAGFEVQRSFTRMVLGANDWPGRPSLVYATSGPEKG